MKQSTLFLSIILFLVACSSGKRQFEMGNYDIAVYKAIKRLKASPNHQKASTVLKEAYKMSLYRHLDLIDQLNKTEAPFRFEQITNHYNELNRIYNQIQKCPACQLLVPNARYFGEELNQSQKLAALEQLNQGKTLLQNNNKLDAQQAYRHFLKAKSFNPNTENIDFLLQKALEQGTFHVLIKPIPMHSRALSLSNDFFEQKIVEYAKGLNYRFVLFYTVNESYPTIDHVIELQFDDFVVGQMHTKERVETLVRDSVKTGEREFKGETIPIYGSVKAEFHQFKKTLNSAGLLNLNILDAKNNNLIRQEKFSGQFVWENTWAFYNGDERALNEEELALCNEKEIYPPPPQDLFIAFTGPIYDQVTRYINRYYRNFRN